jgi:arylsulfatase A-like enzyme
MINRLLAAVVIFATAHLTVAGSPPHIVFILADDLGIGDLSCYGGKTPTPHIDRLAAEGIRFLQYYTAAPVCSPSRCGLITGQYPGRWRITSYLAERTRNRAAEQVDYLDPRAPSLPRILKDAGYRTAHIGKWHLGGGRDVHDAPKFAVYGYDQHVGTYESPEPAADITATDWIWSADDKVKRWQRSEYFVEKTLDFLRRNHNKPCFVNLWLDDVHTPWIPDADTPEKNANIAPNLERVLAEMDRQIGRLTSGLKELGIDDETLIIFTSDNGPYPHLPGRTLNFRGCKLSLYEGGIRVPFIARWPAVVPAGHVDAGSILSALDMLPTLCHVAGAELPAGVAFDGEDALEVLRGERAVQSSRQLFWEYGRNANFFGYPRDSVDRSPNVAVRDGRWKLLINDDGTDAELYDLAEDPSESTNVSEREPAVALRLKNAALKWRQSLP